MTEETTLDLSDLDSIDKKILELLLSQPGISNAEIGEQVDLTRQSIYNRRQAEPLKTIINKMQQSEIDRFMELRRKALEKTEQLINSSDDNISSRMCKELIKTIVPLQVEHSGNIPITITIEGVKSETTES